MRIAVGGAGISGAALAALLSRLPHRPIVDVFEGYSRNRDQGTGFDIRPEAQKVLQASGMWHNFPKISRPGSDVMSLYNHHSPDPLAFIAVPKFLKRFFPDSPEANRELLRDALLEAATENTTIQFEQPITGIRSLPSGRAELLSGKKGEETILGEYDLIIDGCGFNSPLRKYRINDKVRDSKFYTGITMLHCVITDPELTCDPSVVSRLGEGTLFVLGPQGRILVLQRFGARTDDHRTTFYYFIRTEDIGEVSKSVGLRKTSELFEDEDSLSAVRNYIRKDMGSNWGDEYIDLVNHIDRAAVRPIMQHPTNPEFIQDRLPLICLGDALHCVPPWTGSGGNLALEDVGDLCYWLGQVGSSGVCIDALRVQERAFMRRAEKVIREGDKTKEYFMSLRELKDDNITLESVTKACGGTSLHVMVLKALASVSKWGR